jgi:DNA repair protein RadC
LAGEAARLWSDLLIDRFGSLAALLAAKPESQARILPDPSAVEFLGTIRAAMLHSLRREISARPVLSHLQALHDYVHAAIAHAPAEQLWVLLLDSRNHLLAEEVISIGTINEAPVYPREIMRRALEVGATALILVHNHPSGDPQPSDTDIAVTRRVVDAGRELGVRLHDHLVVARGGTISFRALGLL